MIVYGKSGRQGAKPGGTAEG